ncbi:hypothetical protein B0A55_06147 [Friedmanniomyces simplex]|uniref:AP complex mu/sigma subunit domain-containing protein n=1 Tax=Friedmanniomyces simplex TaxID=329884 RepID=A0A4U0XLR8_9PEZI|nr:hypothetical protein B0A55_06147 [Friedmanniomyces simplex]
MINAVLVFNNNGQPRLTKFYTQLDTAVQQRLLSEIFTLVAARPPSSCNFLPLPPLLAPSSRTSTEHNDAPSLVTYRHYATLYFILISTSTESPLALLDLVQVYVEALDRLFENVCELDLIFNFETLHAVLAEMIVGGVVVDTGLEKVVEGVRAQGRVAKRPVNETRGGLSQGIWAGSSVSIPSVLKTTPSGNRYTLHEHKGPGSEPAPTRRSVLIMHPATSAVMPEPPTPMSFTTVGSNDSWDEGDERHFSSSSSGGVSDCASSLDLTGQVNPRNMFAVSFLGTQMEGSTEAYQAFINNVDGFKAKLKARNILPTQPSGSETTKSSSALPFISKTPSLTSDDSSHRDSVASTESEREDNRAQALQALTGNATATTPFPDALQPGRSHRSIQGKPLASRPASAGGSALYFSFTDGFGPFNPYNEPQSPPPALQTADTAPPSSTRPSTPHFADTETHRKHYTAVESGLFDAYSSRPSTPTHFVDTATHREHYSRIESGIFDFATPSSSSSQSPPSCPANPTPDDRTPSFLLPASLHTSSSPSPSPSPSQVKPRPHQIKRKPVHAVNYSKPLDLNKPLPAVPSATHPKRFTNAKVPASFTTNGVVPAPLVMNENGFPIMARSKQQQQQPGRDSGVSRFGGAMHESRTVGAGEGKRAGETKQQRKVTELKGKTGLMTKAMGKLGF